MYGTVAYGTGVKVLLYHILACFKDMYYFLKKAVDRRNTHENIQTFFSPVVGFIALNEHRSMSCV